MAEEIKPSNLTGISEVMERVMYKNRLQEYTQKSSIPLPIYQTVNEGTSHAARFRSTVFVDGSCYKSPNTFSTIKAAEQDVAKMTYECISQKPKDEAFPFLSEDTSLCKSIMNEYSIKMKLEKPIYVTKEAKGLVSVFVSDLVLNGVTYTGQIAKNKKEAERLAARTALLSILDSESKMPMSEIIKSKERLYSLLHGAIAASGGNHLSLETSTNKREEVDAPEDITNVDSPNVGSSAQAQPFHEFKKPRVDSSLEVSPLPIAFVAPNPRPILEFVSCPSSGNGKSRNKKKKSRMIEEGGTMTTDPVPVMLLGQVPSCSVAQ